MARQRTIARPASLALAILAALVAPIAVLAIGGPAGKGAFDVARVAAWACCLLGLVGLYGRLGAEIRGRAGGVLIDERNRFSLSRLQMLAWTTLLLASLYTLVLANALRADATAEIMKIDIDWNLLAASGFNVASLVGAPLALSMKAGVPSAAGDLGKANAQLVAEQGLSQPIAAVGQVMVKGAVDDARWADLFRGEDVQNATGVDLPRLQMLLVSAVVVLGYGVAMVAHLGTGASLLHSLPVFTPTIVTLLLISHSGYLAGKVMPAQPAAASKAAGQGPRALAIAGDATALAARSDAALAQTPAGAPLRNRLQQIQAQAGLVASDANALGAGAPPAGGVDAQALERRLATLQETLADALAQREAAIDQPDAGVVRQVQERLAREGQSLPASGVDDGPTQAALAAWMARTGTDPTSLATSRKRLYEELLQLLQRV